MTLKIMHYHDGHVAWLGDSAATQLASGDAGQTAGELSSSKSESYLPGPTWTCLPAAAQGLAMPVWPAADQSSCGKAKTAPSRCTKYQLDAG